MAKEATCSCGGMEVAEAERQQDDLHLALEQGTKKGARMRWAGAPWIGPSALHVAQTQIWNSLSFGDRGVKSILLGSGEFLLERVCISIFICPE